MADSKSRSFVVDVLRGLAIVLMMLHILPEHLLKELDSSVFYVICFYASRLSFPLFLFLAGFSVPLSAQWRIRRAGKTGYLRHLILRVFYLLILASLVNVFRADGMTSINILHIIGISVLVCGLVKISESVAICIVLLALSLVYSFVGPFESPPRPTTLFDYLLCLFTKGEYPPGMWFVYSLVGLCACWFYSDRLHTKAGLLFAVALVFASAGLIVLGVRSVMWKNTAPFCFLMLACVFGTYYAVNALYVRNRAAFLRPLAVYGRHALSIYVANEFMFITLPNLLGFTNKLNVVETAAAFLGFMSVTLLLIRRYERKSPVYGIRSVPMEVSSLT